MVFSSIEFIFIFLPIFFLVYALVPNTKLKNLVIFVGSVVFYSMGVLDAKIYIVLFVQTILINFLLGWLIQDMEKHRKLLLILGVIYNLWWLMFFKYSGFFVTNVNNILHTNIPERNILLPIGISFYTFQNLSYLVDVYRNKTKASKSLIDYGAYISMFPQLIAGPIVTYDTIEVELRERKHSLKNIDEGLKIFTAGLGYKVLIANQIGGLWKEIETIGFESISTPLAWLGVAAYGFQVYFDFYGYSLMAIGLGLLMGFHLPQNFNQPYLSITMTEFWRRWHITLGSWFREYIYIPLGGNRKGKLRTIRNMLIVWLLTGFWHGANWNFILWGLALFVIMLTEKLFTGKYLNEHRILGHYYLLILISFTWVLFAITDMHDIGIYFQKLLPFLPHETTGRVAEGDYLRYLGTYWKYFVAAVFFCLPVSQKIWQKIKHAPEVVSVLCLGVFFSCVYCMYKGMNDPFLYFRF